ncbi:MAG: hypothetical protein JNL32_05070 [Candidatus Kapabacteria bacterium]|nr:hypothetical protein [Candidatus Kapabacteria bacterium]
MMKKTTYILILTVATLFWGLSTELAAAPDEKDSILTALKTIDPGIVKYFPRWRICEPNLQIQIQQTFILNGRKRERLDMQNITVTAGPKGDPTDPYIILLVECGDESFVASEVDAYMKKLAYTISEPTRPYCFRELPKETPLSEKQYRIITDYMMPTDVQHSISVSAFEQSLKIGRTGFWIRNMIGTDAVGYNFWSSGEARVILQRPLYENTDPETSSPIPFLINAKLGAGYRLTSGGLERGILSFIPQRQLNSVPNGKAVAGIDVHAPFHPQVGLSVNAELPLGGGPDTSRVAEMNTWATYRTSPEQRNTIALNDPTRRIDASRVIPVLRATGQVAVFYNWWLDPKKPENFFRFDLGINYAEVQEWAIRRVADRRVEDSVYQIVSSANGLVTYKPNELADWIYAKIEYRNQSTFPFGVTAQYSNQMLFMRAYMPLVGEWLYLEGKYSTPLRSTPRPWEPANFFMISPVLRLNIR